MRILSIGNFSGRAWDGSITDENHIANALEQLGHEVIRQQREDNNLNTGGTINTGQSDNVDFILIAQWDRYPENMVPDLKKTFKVPIVYWAFDYQADGQDWHEKLVVSSDLYLSKRIADSKYPGWQWLSQDYAPEFLRKAPYPNKDIDVLFTGSYLPWAKERNETLKAVDEKFNLVIHSVNEWPGFKDVRPPILDEGLPGLYSRAKVILSIDHTIEAGYWSDRTAQIMCCGRRPLFRYVPLSEVRFRDCVDYFYNVDDCLKKIEERLVKDNPKKDQKSCKFGQRYLRTHNRVKDLLTIVNAYLNVRSV
jgi:hypothetical protein